MHELNEKKLRLSTAVESRTLPDDMRLLKQTSRGEYLALNAAQQRIFDRFNGTQSVQEILHALLATGEPVKIRAFYDLVLTALDKGFFFAGEREPSSPPLVGRRWPVHSSPAAIIGLFLGLAIAGTSVFVSSPLQAIAAVPEWLHVLLMVAAGLSVAHLLAGCALSGLGRQVYGPVLRLDHALPYLYVDTRDAFMGGRLVEACVALQTLGAPFVLAIAAGLAHWPYALIAAWITMLILASPFGGTPAHNLLHALFRKEYQLPKCAEHFLSKKMLAQFFNFRVQLAEEKYFLVYSTYAILWLGLVYRFSVRLLEAQGNAFAELLVQSSAAQHRLPMLVIFGLLAGVVAAPLAYAAWVLLRGGHRWLAPKFFNIEASLQRRSETTQRPQLAEIQRFLKDTLLFAPLPTPELAKVATAMKFVRVEPNTFIVRERDLGNLLFVVHTGTVEVLKETEAGQQARVATLGPGDVFGEIALLDQVPRTSSVRSTSHATLLALAKEDFEQLLLSTLGAKGVKDAVQVCAFLKRNPLFAEWHPQPLLKLASAFEFQNYQAGEVLIKENQTNEYFFLVHSGELVVRKQGQPCATLGPGDFCGEVSLLKNAAANAEVAAVKPGRCLRLGKNDFLQLISQSFLTGLTIENVMQDRSLPGGAR